MKVRVQYEQAHRTEHRKIVPITNKTTPNRTLVCAYFGSCPLQVNLRTFQTHNSICIWLLKDEHTKVRRDELRLLEGANTRLSDREGANRSHRECRRTHQPQARRMEPVGPDSLCKGLDAPLLVCVLHRAVVSSTINTQKSNIIFCHTNFKSLIGMVVNLLGKL